MDSKGRFVLDNRYFVTEYFKTDMSIHTIRRDKKFIHVLQFLLSTDFFIADILAEIETRGFLNYRDVCYEHWFKYYCNMDESSFEYYYQLGRLKPDDWYLRYKIKNEVVSTEPSVVSTEPSVVSTEPSVVSTEPSR
jgi:hypothetical protein